MGEHDDGTPILAKIKLGYGDLLVQAHALVDNLPIEFFVAHEIK